MHITGLSFRLRPVWTARSRSSHCWGRQKIQDSTKCKGKGGAFEAQAAEGGRAWLAHRGCQAPDTGWAPPAAPQKELLSKGPAGLSLFRSQTQHPPAGSRAAPVLCLLQPRLLPGSRPTPWHRHSSDHPKRARQRVAPALSRGAEKGPRGQACFVTQGAPANRPGSQRRLSHHGNPALPLASSAASGLPPLSEQGSRVWPRPSSWEGLGHPAGPAKGSPRRQPSGPREAPKQEAKAHPSPAPAPAPAQRQAAAGQGGSTKPSARREFAQGPSRRPMPFVGELAFEPSANQTPVAQGRARRSGAEPSSARLKTPPLRAPEAAAPGRAGRGGSSLRAAQTPPPPPEAATFTLMDTMQKREGVYIHGGGEEAAAAAHWRRCRRRSVHAQKLHSLLLFQRSGCSLARLFPALSPSGGAARSLAGAQPPPAGRACLPYQLLRGPALPLPAAAAAPRPAPRCHLPPAETPINPPGRPAHAPQRSGPAPGVTSAELGSGQSPRGAAAPGSLCTAAGGGRGRRPGEAERQHLPGPAPETARVQNPGPEPTMQGACAFYARGG